MAELTIREKIVQQLQTVVLDIKDDYNRVWNVTDRDNLDSLENTQLPALGIEESEEEVIRLMFPCVEKSITLIFNFQFSNNMGENAYNRYNYYLGLLQKNLLADRRVNNLAIDIREIGNTPEIASKRDPRPGGALFIEVLYRHKTDDPYIHL